MKNNSETTWLKLTLFEGKHISEKPHTGTNRESKKEARLSYSHISHHDDLEHIIKRITPAEDIRTIMTECNDAMVNQTRKVYKWKIWKWMVMLNNKHLRWRNKREITCTFILPRSESKDKLIALQVPNRTQVYTIIIFYEWIIERLQRNSFQCPIILLNSPGKFIPLTVQYVDIIKRIMNYIQGRFPSVWRRWYDGMWKGGFGQINIDMMHFSLEGIRFFLT